MTSIFQILMLLLDVASFFIFAHFIMSWLIQFEVLNVRQPLVGQIWYGLQRILEPIYRPIRNILPNMGGIDLTPLVALIGIEIIRVHSAPKLGRREDAKGTHATERICDDVPRTKFFQQPRSFPRQSSAPVYVPQIEFEFNTVLVYCHRRIGRSR